MARKPRVEFDGALYHVICAAISGSEPFKTTKTDARTLNASSTIGSATEKGSGVFWGSYRNYGSGLTALRCVLRIHLGICQKKKRRQVNASHWCPQLSCQRDFLCCRVSPRQARPFLFRQKGPKPLTPRLASLKRTDASLRRADQLAPLKQGPPGDESVPPLGQTAGVGTWERGRESFLTLE